MWERGERVGKSGGFVKRTVLVKTRALELRGDRFQATAISAVRLYTGPPSPLLTLHLPPPQPQLTPPPPQAFFSACQAKELSKEEGRAAGYHIFVWGTKEPSSSGRYRTPESVRSNPTAADTNCLRFPVRYIWPSLGDTASWLAGNNSRDGN